MKLREIMSQPVVSVSATASVRHAAGVMDRFSYSFLPVIDRDRILGVITGRDLAARAMGRGLPMDTTLVSAIMSRPAICLNGDYQPEDALVLMRQHNIRRILVTEGEKKLIGIVGLSDIAGRVNPDAIAEMLHRHAEQASHLTTASAATLPGLYLG